MKKLKTADLNRKDIDTFKSAKKIPVCVVLDNVRSLLNVGSIFRTCDAFLVEKIWLCGITGQPPHREIQKTALGATESMEWGYEEDITILAGNLKMDGYQIVGIEQTDKSILLNAFEIQENRKYALVFGNEVDGISDELLSYLDQAIEIPQQGIKHSLNVSVAAGIVIYRFFENHV
jgi:23S rRNA (guanosine2251-2'-O)-methyltransferase